MQEAIEYVIIGISAALIAYVVFLLARWYRRHQEWLLNFGAIHLMTKLREKAGKDSVDPVSGSRTESELREVIRYKDLFLDAVRRGKLSPDDPEVHDQAVSIFTEISRLMAGKVEALRRVMTKGRADPETVEILYAHDTKTLDDEEDKLLESFRQHGFNFGEDIVDFRQPLTFVAVHDQV